MDRPDASAQNPSGTAAAALPAGRWTGIRGLLRAPMRLWLRLFLAIAALCLLSLGGLLWWQQRSFARGFTDYLDAIAQQQAVLVAERLATRYRETGSWDWLRRDPRAFLRLASRSGVAAADEIDVTRVDAPGYPPPPRPRPGERGPPRFGADFPPPAPGPGGRPPPGSPPPRNQNAERLALFDEAGSYVVGNRRPQQLAEAVPVQVDGRTVGTLRIAALPRPTGELEETFAASQRRAALVAAAVIVPGALLLAYLLARGLLGPVQMLSAGTRALAAGDYTRRVPQRGQDELAVLARDFNRLAATLEEHREARRRWGADIAHELRTPLTVLRIELQTLIDGIRRADGPALQSLLSECERLSALTEDLYQLSLADAGALEYRFERVELGELMADAADLHRRPLAEAGIDLQLDEPPAPLWLRGDRRRLAQLLHNLLVNARRYTDAPGKVVMQARQDGASVELLVEDSPPGVDAADRTRLFERLYRVEASRSRASGGAGLGLAICRSIADAHDGHIEALESPLGGLRIRLRLPADKDTPP